ncbi:hypothetical protein [Acidovorax sp. LjRoot117]|uniref:hypothetical protein n=1 Tax=Acidovorax sp. LjRoot117 TaxID=3342255 RepID=UPI003ED16889
MASRLLIALLTGLGLVSGGYWWGHTATNNARDAQQAKADQKARTALDNETARADQAAASYLQEHLDQEDRYAALNATYQDLRRRAPLVVPGPVVDVTRSDAPGPEAPGPDQRHAAAAPVDGGPVLTLAAVRMWNGALTGTDQAAGACGPAGASEGADAACAQGSGLTLDDAWANHTANAQACAADRQRYQHLIDFLNGK